MNNTLSPEEFNRRLNRVVRAVKEETREDPYFGARHIAKRTGFSNVLVGYYLPRINENAKDITVQKISNRTWKRTE